MRTRVDGEKKLMDRDARLISQRELSRKHKKYGKSNRKTFEAADKR